jgi:hypothetical protein
MAFNGSGVFARIYNWATESGSPPIAISKLDTQEEDIASGLSSCITKDGQTTITAAIPFNDKRITGLGNATADADALNRVTADSRYGLPVSGTFTGTLTGFGTPPTGDVSYRIKNNIVTLYLGDGIVGTSSSTSMTMTGLPVAVRPTSSRSIPCYVQDNSDNDLLGSALVQDDGTILFYMNSTTLATARVKRTLTGFTGSGVKGLNGDWVVVYPLS